MSPRIARFAAAALLGCVGSAQAVQLLATGTLPGTASDLSGLTAPLDNGVAGKLLCGMGSGLAWAGGNTFLALPDRGPNAVSYAASVDDTVSYDTRFQTVTLALTAGSSGLPFTLTPTVSATTLLSSSTALVYGSGAGLTRNDGTALGSGVPTIHTASRFHFTAARTISTRPRTRRTRTTPASTAKASACRPTPRASSSATSRP